MRRKKEKYKSVFDFVEKETRLTEEQLNLEKQLAGIELLKFTRARINQAENLTILVNKAMDLLMQRLNNDQEEPISVQVLISLIEKFSNSQNNLMSGIYGAIKTSNLQQNYNHNKDLQTESFEKEKEDIDKQEYKLAKVLLDIINKNKDAEI